MRRTVLTCLLALVLAVGGTAPAGAQPSTEKKGPTAEQKAKDDASGKVPVFEFFLAIVGSGAVLFVLCTPSRKR